MKRAGWLLTAGVLTGCLLYAPLSVTVYAEAATPTPDEYWLKDTELKIAAYQRTANGDDLEYLEVYNDSDHLLDIADWKILGAFGTAMLRYELPVTQLAPGLMKPMSHAVIQISSEVGAASFDGSAWAGRPVGDVSLLVTLEVSAKAAGWKTDAYVMKTSSRSTVDPVTNKTVVTTVYDDFWVRSQISGQSYTATLTSFTTSSLALHDDGLYQVPQAFPGEIVEVYSYASDCDPADKSLLCGDYIKLHVDKNADLSLFALRSSNNSTSRSVTNTFTFDTLAPTSDGYVTLHLRADGEELELTNSGGYLWIEDVFGAVVYDVTRIVYPNSPEKYQGFAYMLDAKGQWKWTTTPRPGLENSYTPLTVALCPEGKYLNPDTGRCRTIEEAVNALASCPEGQERNPATNRCRSKVLAVSSGLTPCKEGQERNPLTNRCRSIASAVAELLPCDEGYERNPATNRCRKVLGVGALREEEQAKSSMVTGSFDERWNLWTWALVGVGATGAIGYGVYEWRNELFGLGRKIAAKLGKR